MKKKGVPIRYFSHFGKNPYLFIYLVELGFELRASHFSHTSSLCSGYFGDGGLVNYLPWLASNHDLPDLSLPSC
jgi:hypothetical protein